MLSNQCEINSDVFGSVAHILSCDSAVMTAFYKNKLAEVHLINYKIFTLFILMPAKDPQMENLNTALISRRRLAD